MKRLFLLGALMVSTLVSAQYVKSNGKAIFDGSGHTLLIRAMGIGGWMVQEGYMLQTASFANPQHKIKDTIEDLIGATATEAFYDAWLENHFNKADVDSMAAWGFNTIRVPMHYNLFTLPIEEEPVLGQNTWLNKGFNLLDSVVTWAEDAGLYVILDLHAAPGGQGYDQGISDYDPTKPSLWESVHNRTKTVALWKKLAEKFATDTTIAGYDLINEPNWNLPGGTLLRNLYEDITDSIRTVDTNHIIFIEGNWFANTFTGLTPPWDNNMAYSPHKYWSPVNSVADIQYGLDLRDTYNVPIWFGETGENSNAWYTGLISIMESEGVGWAWWPLKKVETINAPLSIDKNLGYQQLLNYWSGSASAPSVADATAALMQLATNLKAENCTYNRGVIDAMFRQIYDPTALPWKEHTIPGIVHASEYDMGPLGVAYYDTESMQLNPPPAWNSGWTYRNDGVDVQAFSDFVNSNGYCVGWVDTDDWMQYTVDIAQDSVYTIKVRQGANGATGGNFYFEADGVKLTPNYYASNTGSWSILADKVIPNVILSSEDKTLRFVANSGGFNVASFEFIPTGSTTALDAEYVSSNTYSYTEIEVKTNKPLDTTQLGNFASYFVTINGNQASVVNIAPSPNNVRNFILTLNQNMTFLDEMKVSYSGTTLKAKDGTSVDPFTQELVENTLPTVHVIPGKIEAEAYSSMDGISLENTSDVGGGQNIGYLDGGDYLLYDIKVLNNATYSIDYRHASQSNGKIQFELYDTSGTYLSNMPEVTLPLTGGWQTWTTTSGNAGVLTQGDYILKLNVIQAPVNINWFEFIQGIGLDEELVSDQLMVYPNPAQDGFRLGGMWTEGTQLEMYVYDESGRLWMKESLAYTRDRVISTKDLSTGTYLVTVVSSGRRFTEKLLIVH